MRKMRVILLGTLGGLGVIYLITAGVMLIANGKVSLEQIRTVADSSNPLPILILVFGGVGLLLLAIGLGLYFGLGRSERKRRDLLLYGRIVQGTVTDVRRNTNVRINGQNPRYAIVSCRHPVTMEDMKIRSHSVMDLTISPGDTVRVAFDPMNDRKYAVDLSEGDKA